MSLKVWIAYELKRPSTLWEFAASVRVKAQENIKRTLRKYYEGYILMLKEDPKTRRWFIERMSESIGIMQSDKITLTDLSHYVFLEFKKTLGELEHNPFDFDISLVFRQYEGRIFMVPYTAGMAGNALDFLKRDPRVRDFHYQNSTDKSAKCSDAAWERRGKVWDRLLEEDKFGDKLVLEIASYCGFHRFDPWLEMAREDNKRKDRKYIVLLTKREQNLAKKLRPPTKLSNN